LSFILLLREREFRVGEERNRRSRKERAEENSGGELILVCVLPATR
jgi:hypothetical protein